VAASSRQADSASLRNTLTEALVRGVGGFWNTATLRTATAALVRGVGGVLEHGEFEDGGGPRRTLC
jgi:hypothetical protein